MQLRTCLRIPLILPTSKLVNATLIRFSSRFLHLGEILIVNSCLAPLTRFLNLFGFAGDWPAFLTRRRRTAIFVEGNPASVIHAFPRNTRQVA